MHKKLQKDIFEKLSLLYGEQSAKDIFPEVLSVIEDCPCEKSTAKDWLTEQDVFLITYGDMALKFDTISAT